MPPKAHKVTQAETPHGRLAAHYCTSALQFGSGKLAREWERTIGWAACVGAVLLLVAALVGARVEAAAGVRVGDAVVRLAAVPGRPAAGYFTLSGGPATLVQVTSPLATKLELHSSSMAGGMMRMDALPAVKLLAGQTVSFAPGGDHLMIFGLSAQMTPGATVPLDFRFEGGQVVRVTARTVAAGAEIAPMDHGTHMAH